MLKNITALAMLMITTMGLSQTNLIVRLRPGADVGSLAQTYAIEYREMAPGAPFALFVVPAGGNKAAIQAQMSLNPNVVWVEDDASLAMPEEVSGGKGTTTAVVNDRNAAYAMNSGALGQIGYSSAFCQEPGRPMRIAVLDTGLAPSCTLLWSKVIGQYNAIDGPSAAYDVPRNCDSNQNGMPDEGVGHGTFVAGIVDQMSPLSSLVIVRVADSDGRATAWSLIKGISYAAAAKSEVANISLGSTDSIPALGDVLEWATLKGVFFVGAAGNDNMEMIIQPALSSKVFAVTGINAINRKAPFANYHNKIEACAPSVGVLSYGPNGRLMVWSGTSFASPFVAGAIAECLRHRSSKVRPDDLYNQIKDYGMSMDAANPNYRKKLGRKIWIPTLWNRIRVMAP